MPSLGLRLRLRLGQELPPSPSAPPVTAGLVSWEDGNRLELGTPPDVASWTLRKAALGVSESAQAMDLLRPHRVAADADFNGSNSVQFDGLDDYLVRPNPVAGGDWTQVWIATKDALAGTRVLQCFGYESVDTDSMAPNVNTSGQPALSHTSGGTTFGGVGTIAAGQAFFLSMSLAHTGGDTADVACNLNGTRQTAAFASGVDINVDTDNLGSRLIAGTRTLPWDGKIVARLLYDRALSAAEEAALNTYFTRVYRL